MSDSLCPHATIVPHRSLQQLLFYYCTSTSIYLASEYRRDHVFLCLAYPTYCKIAPIHSFLSKMTECIVLVEWCSIACECVNLCAQAHVLYPSLYQLSGRLIPCLGSCGKCCIKPGRADGPDVGILFSLGTSPEVGQWMVQQIQLSSLEAFSYCSLE